MNNKEYEKLHENMDKILNEDFIDSNSKHVLNEMSKAFSYKNKGIDVCVWVEGPMGVDNQYFKYYDDMYYSNAKKVARIRIDKPEYVGGEHKEKSIKKWVLTKKEKQELVNILKGPSDEHENLTRWQEILITYNKDNFNISSKDTINGKLDDSQRNPKMPKHLKPFSINFPMPNYLNLK